MSQLNKTLNSVSADNIYFDLLVSNFNQTTAESSVFSFTETRSSPFLMKPDDYKMSIVRFTIDTGTLPVFIPSIEPNSIDLNKTIYTVSLTYQPVADGVVYSSDDAITGAVRVYWEAQDKNALVPSPPSLQSNKLQDNSTGYYNCYNYTWFIYLVNVALRTAFQTLSAKVVGAGKTMPTNYAPVMNWDTTSNQAYFLLDQLAYDVNLPNNEQIFFYMNASLYSLFGSFPAIQTLYDATKGKQYQIVGSNVAGTNIRYVTDTAQDISWNALQIYQEYSTIELWNPIQALVFTSQSLPIEPNQVSTPLIYSNNQQIGYGGTNNATQNIITDLVSESGLYKPNLVYLPTAQYRYISLMSNTPLYTIDVNIFYRLRNSQLVPFRLQSGGSVSMKVLFEKK